MYRTLGADQQVYGPVAADEVRQWIIERRLSAQSLVRGEGDAEWKPLALFPEFSATLASVTGESWAMPAPMPTNIRTGSTINSMAVAGFVMGILALGFGCCCYGFPFNILGLVFSVIALRQIRTNPDTQTGKTLAIVGLVLSLLGLLLAVVYWLAAGATSLSHQLLK